MSSDYCCSYLTTCENRPGVFWLNIMMSQGSWPLSCHRFIPLDTWEGAYELWPKCDLNLEKFPEGVPQILQSREWSRHMGEQNAAPLAKKHEKRDSWWGLCATSGCLDSYTKLCVHVRRINSLILQKITSVTVRTDAPTHSIQWRLGQDVFLSICPENSSNLESFLWLSLTKVAQLKSHNTPATQSKQSS